MKKRHFILWLLFFVVRSTIAVEHSSAFFSQNGVRGTVTFAPASDGRVEISVDLRVDSERAGEYSWGVYPFPIDYSVPDICHSRILGRKPVINLDDSLNKLNLPAVKVKYATNALNLRGPDSVWAKSLVLEGPDRSRICASITPESERFKTAEARFRRGVGGSVWFKTLPVEGKAVETKIYSNLFHLKSAKSSTHAWKIFITDKIQSKRSRFSCDYLQGLYDPENRNGNVECSAESPEKCPQGDLTGKFGRVKVGRRESMFTKSYHTDMTLDLPNLKSQWSLYLVLYDPENPDEFLTCAEIVPVEPKSAKASFAADGVIGYLRFSQLNTFSPVRTDISLSGLNGRGGGYHVHELPITQRVKIEDNPCLKTGPHYNPDSRDSSSSPKNGTFDEYEVGDLSGKYGSLANKSEFSFASKDPSLAIFGERSVVGRSVVIHRAEKGERWICTGIEEEGVKATVTAQVRFAYPVAGSILFRQDAANPNADTSVFVEDLVYSDGGEYDTSNHAWHVHTDKPGPDALNWTARCVSAGPHYNPYETSTDDSVYGACINERNAFQCEVGDLGNKHGRLSVSGSVLDRMRSRRFFTDINLPLSGRFSVVGRSVVIHDDKAPKHRGNRMVCASIVRQYRYKAVAKEWFGNGDMNAPSGRLEFVQDTPTGLTHTLVDLRGLRGVANAYHVHVVPLRTDLEFPCTGEVVGGHYNPFEVRGSEGGTPDRFEAGDLSGKYGYIADLEEKRAIYNDSNLPLLGPESIVGRSIVIHKKGNGERWACANVGWGFSPSEAQEVRAIASFHHPSGFAWGYIRFRQVVYRDGGTTSASIEVRLKYPGENNGKKTTGHKWAVHISTTGPDAAVKYSPVRCTAAGFRWNPTLIQYANQIDKDHYERECGEDFPSRCETGDMSGKLGPLTIGGEVQVLHDTTGLSVEELFGRSVVIYDADGSWARMSCASIEKDTDIVKSTLIRVHARFNLDAFMRETRAVMGVPEWFLHTDARKTRLLNEGRCMQIQLRFNGPDALKLEKDFSRLLRTGKLANPSLLIPGYIPDPLRKKTLSYRECGNERLRQTSHRGKNSYGGAAEKSSALLTVLATGFLIALH